MKYQAPVVRSWREQMIRNKYKNVLLDFSSYSVNFNQKRRKLSQWWKKKKWREKKKKRHYGPSKNQGHVKMQCTVINNPEAVTPELDRNLFVPLPLPHIKSCFCIHGFVNYCNYLIFQVFFLLSTKCRLQTADWIQNADSEFILFFRLKRYHKSCYT